MSNEKTPLQILNDALDIAIDNMAKATDRQQKLDANLEIYKIQQSIKIEIANEAKVVKEKELAEKRNARVLLADDMINTYIASEKANKDKALSIEEKNAIHDLHKAAREKVINELLAKHPSSTPSVKADGTASTGTKSVEIRKILTDDLDAGKTITEAKKNAEAAGYTRGTVGTVATALMAERSATV